MEKENGQFTKHVHIKENNEKETSYHLHIDTRKML